MLCFDDGRMPTGYQALLASLRREQRQHEKKAPKQSHSIQRANRARRNGSLIVGARAPRRAGRRARPPRPCPRPPPRRPPGRLIKLLFNRYVGPSKRLSKKQFCNLVTQYGLTRHRTCSKGTLDLIYMRVSGK